MFQDLPFYCTKKILKNHINFFFNSVTGWNSLPGACSDPDITQEWKTGETHGKNVVYVKIAYNFQNWNAGMRPKKFVI